MRAEHEVVTRVSRLHKACLGTSSTCPHRHKSKQHEVLRVDTRHDGRENDTQTPFLNIARQHIDNKGGSAVLCAADYSGTSQTTVSIANGAPVEGVVRVPGRRAHAGTIRATRWSAHAAMLPGCPNIAGNPDNRSLTMTQAGEALPNHARLACALMTTSAFTLHKFVGARSLGKRPPMATLTRTARACHSN